MPPKHQRKSHTKSKSGCSQCKVRRIKCNEQHPICSNCERRQITCDFELSPDGSRPSPKSSGTNITPQSSSPNIVTTSTTTNPSLSIPLSQPDLVSTKKSTTLDVVDLQLMHHFTTIVAVDLARKNHKDAGDLWSIHAIRLSFKHDFLLRGILAVAAYHISHYSPEKKTEYDLIGSKHQSLAVKSFQETLAEVSESNCHALFAFSCLIVIMAFASNSRDKPSDFNTDVLQWFYLLRGANIVLNLHSESIRYSFLSPLLEQMTHTETAAPHDIPDIDRITDLFRVCNAREHDRETSQAYTLAVHSLLSTFTQVSVCKQRGDGTVLPGFVWPLNLPPKFLDLLSDKEPEAMVILAYYCVVIYWGEEDEAWFLGGWSRYILEAIKDSVPERWHSYLEWPGETIK